MSLANATARFNRTAFANRQAMWPITVTSGTTTGIDAVKSPTTLKRVPNEQGSGWTQQAHATFNFAAGGAFAATIGSEFTITSSDTADEISTTWRCFDLRRRNPATGADHRCVCFRLD